MGNALDLKGDRFGRLEVIERLENNKYGKSRWNCLCDCGNTVVVVGNSLRTGNTSSCGCLNLENSSKLGRSNATHGMANTPEFRCWTSILQRCNNPNNQAYVNYGGRGIKVDWESFEEFYADMGTRPTPRHSVERKDVNGSYCKENCVWATPDIQSRNRRVPKNCSSGHLGVKWTERNKWRVTIKVSGHLKHIGYFSDLNEAIQARKKAEIEYWGEIHSDQ